MITKRDSHSLAVVYLEVAKLKAHPNTPRTHSKTQIDQIARSIQYYGWVNPLIVDDKGRVLCGCGRLAAAKKLNIREAPTVCVSGMSEADKRAYIIADNVLAEKAGWDKELLVAELFFLADPELGFELELTGFEMAEIDALLLQEGITVIGEEETVDEPDPGAPIISRVGDLWHIGDHRLLCGDARDRAAYERLLSGEKAQLVLTDPPYNVPISGHVSGLGEVTHREFAMASGEMTPTQFTAFLHDVMQQLAEASAPGAINMVFMDWRHMREIIDASATIYSELKNVCVWAKTNAGMGTFYRSQHELCFLFKVGTAKHINNFGLGEKGRHRSNLWTYAGVNGFRSGRAEELASHPTCKPVTMLADAILDCSKRKGIVLDAFCGSGSTLLAAHQTGRRGAAIEIDPGYVDLSIRRLQTESGLIARLDSGETFEEVSRIRTVKAAA